MKPGEFVSKAVRAAASAKLLLEDGDVDGACNRAYYAMFDAARAALMVSGVPDVAEIAKTHSGLIAAFGLLLVKTGQVASELGRNLNRAQEIRAMADYREETVGHEHAHWIVEEAQSFVQTIQEKFFPQPPSSGGRS